MDCQFAVVHTTHVDWVGSYGGSGTAACMADGVVTKVAMIQKSVTVMRCKENTKQVDEE
jgi:ABC-type sulfate transport system substrate-binding protein